MMNKGKWVVHPSTQLAIRLADRLVAERRWTVRWSRAYRAALKTLRRSKQIRWKTVRIVMEKPE